MRNSPTSVRFLTIVQRVLRAAVACCIACLVTFIAMPLAAQTPATEDADLKRAQKQADSVFRWIKLHAEPKRKPEASPKPRPKPEAPQPIVRKPETQNTAAESPAIRETVSAPNAQRLSEPVSAVVAPIAGASAPASAPAGVPVPEEPVVAAAEEEEEEEEDLRPIAQPQPEIPRELRTSVVTGRVILGFTVQTDGTVASVAVVRATNRRLAKPAQDAVSKWRFQPIRTARAVQVEIEFNLQ